MKIILYADLHLRSDTPESRLDDYFQTQESQIDWLRETFKDHIHICAGDVVHRARERKEPIGFANYLASRIPKMYGVLGNHDLLYHNEEFISKTTLGVLITTGKFNRLDPQSPLILKHEDYVEPVYVYGFDYGTEIQHVKRKDDGVYIAVYHGMVTQQEDPFLGGVTAKELLKEFPEYDIILTGDNHKQFVVIDDDRAVVNPGSFKRDNVDQVDHVPRVFILDPGSKKISTIEVPIENEVIDRTNIEVVKERNERLERLSERFEDAKNITLDFHENVITYMKENEVSDDVELKVLEWLG